MLALHSRAYIESLCYLVPNSQGYLAHGAALKGLYLTRRRLFSCFRGWTLPRLPNETVKCHDEGKDDSSRGGNEKARCGADTGYVAGRLCCTVRSNGLRTHCFCRRPMGRGRKLPCLFVSCRVRRRSQCGVSCAKRGYAVLKTWIPAEGRSIRSRCPPRCRLRGSAIEQRGTHDYVPWGLTSHR